MSVTTIVGAATLSGSSAAQALGLRETFQVAWLLGNGSLLASGTVGGPILAPVLNEADAIYLGEQVADAVYAGSTRVWP